MFSAQEVSWSLSSILKNGCKLAHIFLIQYGPVNQDHAVSGVVLTRTVELYLAGDIFAKAHIWELGLMLMFSTASGCSPLFSLTHPFLLRATLPLLIQKMRDGGTGGGGGSEQMNKRVSLQICCCLQGLPPLIWWKGQTYGSHYHSVQLCLIFWFLQSWVNNPKNLCCNLDNLDCMAKGWDLQKKPQKKEMKKPNQ